MRGYYCDSLVSWSMSSDTLLGFGVTAVLSFSLLHLQGRTLTSTLWTRNCCPLLHPFVTGVMSAGSHRLQCAAFQVMAGHCFPGDYSTAFRAGSEDQTDCPGCGAFYSHTHVLDTCPALEGEQWVFLHGHSSYSIFSCAETGRYLVDFLFHMQRLLRPLDPVPGPIPPEPDP
jgi:hypothetical protein